MDPIQNIKINETNLTKSELVIMQYVLKNLDSIPNLSLVDFANESGSSKSGALRFCQKIGYEGFSEFKYDITYYLSLKEQSETSSNNTTSIATIYSDAIKKLDLTLQPQVLQGLKDKINTSRKVKVFGIAETGLTADFFKFRMAAYGYDVESISELNIMNLKANNSNSEDLHIIFSLSANTEAITEVINISLKNNVSVALITQNDRARVKDDVNYFILLPVFEYNKNFDQILDSQVINHAFIGVFLNSLIKETK